MLISNMRTLFFIIVAGLSSSVFASPIDPPTPANGMNIWGFTLVSLLSRIESILLYAVTPIVAIGLGLYIAYELFTADGDESANKKAWKSLTYGAIGLIAIALAYVMIRIVLSLSI